MQEEKKESTGFISKVKEAASTATAKVSEIKENFWDEEKAAIASEFKDHGVEKVRSLFQNINNSSVIIDHSGFSLIYIAVNLGIPPDVSASFSIKEKISDEDRNKVLEEAKGNKLLTVLINCLFKATDFNEKVKMGNYKFDSVDITLGLTPGIKIRFVK